MEGPELIAEETGELDAEDVFDGGDDGVLTLALAEAAQELQVVVEQLFQAREDAVDDVRGDAQLTAHSFSEYLWWIPIQIH